MVIPATTLWHITLVEAILLAASFVAFVVHGTALWWYRRLTRGRIAEARQQLAVLLSTPHGTQPALSLPASLSTSVRTRIVVDLARNLDGVGRQQLSHLAGQLGLIEHAKRQCSSRRWSKRLEGARLLTLLGGGEDVMPGLLHDRHPIIRAQAAEWAGDHPDPDVIDRLLHLLEDDQTISRYAVEDSLSRLGGSAVAPLAAFIASHQGRAIIPALRAAARLGDRHLLEPAVARCHDDDCAVRAGATDLLGVLGGTAALTLLTDLLDDPAQDVRAAACRSLGRLMHWSSAPAVAALLRDPSWTVRRDAAMALRAFGGPGILLLRRMVRDQDAFAADMARQVLDLPASHQGIVA